MPAKTKNHTQPFKAETRQLLNILVHSLYSEREVFLRELISNASDALTRMNYEMLTNRDVFNPDAELGIWITSNEEERTLTIRDTGIGMTAGEMAENLGTIAHSGARAFIQAAENNETRLSDIIGQFGVGFYSAFMVAEWIRVTSRSFKQDAEAAVWFSSGEDTYTIDPADLSERGTIIEIKLKEDAEEFTKPYRLNEIIKRHSDFVPFPIYVGEEKKQANQQTALWRMPSREIKPEQIDEFYRQFTLDIEKPLAYAHLNIDAPVQLYALLFVPSSPERTMFALRKEDGLKLYARKVLIQEYCRDLLPEYLRFIHGIVDSEDIPLNVSRETVQASRVMPQLKRIVTGKAIDMLKEFATGHPDDYAKFWKDFYRFIKEGIATDRENGDNLAPLLRYFSLNHPDEAISLDQYIAEMKPSQTKIFYILGDDHRSSARSPHLDIYRKLGVDVLLMTDPLDSFVLLALTHYKEHQLSSAAAEKPGLETAEEQKEEKIEAGDENQFDGLLDRFKQRLGEQISDVRLTDRLLDSPARLVDKEGSMQQEVQRVYRMLKQDYDAPKKVLELNPKHELIARISQLDSTNPLSDLAIDQVYENALLIEGLHPDPAGMIERIQKILMSALDK